MGIHMKSLFYMKLNICVFASTSENGALILHFKTIILKTYKNILIYFFHVKAKNLHHPPHPSSWPLWGRRGSNYVNAKLMLNVAHHGQEKKKNFHSIPPRTALNDNFFLSFYLTEKHQTYVLYQTFIKKLCKKSVEITLNLWKSNFYLYRQ